MLFSSIIFLCIFFPLNFIFYYTATYFCRLYAKKKKLQRVPTAPRNAVLLIFSLIFYTFGEVKYLWLLVASIVVNYLFALLIDKVRENKALSRLFLILSLIFNFGTLGFYKYLGFLVGTVNSIFPSDIAVPNIILPIGISFFTFQIASYVIDVYRNDVKAQKNPFVVAVYLCAFPQLIAGPIVRYSDVEKELYERTETPQDTSRGLGRFIIGLSKKLIIANTMAAVAEGIYAYAPVEYGVIGAWVAAIAYTLQIYYDFSGYSDMAIGMGRMMGFRYLENFNYPYSAVTVTDFWRRWHMSLSTFFKDYVYIPMGGNRVSVPRWIINMLIVWGLTGFWHGASFNFLIWGLYYGILLILEKKLLSKFLAKHRIISRIYVILSFIVGWVIFRVEDISKLGGALFALVNGYGIGRGEISAFTILKRAECGIFFIVIAVIGIFLSTPNGLFGLPSLRIKLFGTVDEKISPTKAGSALSGVVCVVLLLVCIVMLESGSYNPFIYFRF
jgi:alginate O-acetyltransferase complex protein AlgI